MNRSDPVELLRRVRDGDESAWGELLEHYRAYLKFLAQRRIDPGLQARVDASDVVQQTFLEAQRDLKGFRGKEEYEFIGWLRRILDHNVSEAIERHIKTKKRSTRREQSMDDTRGKGVSMRGFLESEQSTPSQRVMRGEDAVKLARAVSELPPDQSEAVRLRHFEGWTLKQLAEHFDRSEVAVAGLLKRGLQGLRKRLEADSS